MTAMPNNASHLIQNTVSPQSQRLRFRKSHDCRECHLNLATVNPVRNLLDTSAKE